MTRARSTPSSLLAQFAADETARATATAAAVTDAQAQYWRTIDHLASGDESGGIDRASFAAILQTLQVDIAKVRSDVAIVQRVRQTRRDLEALGTSIVAFTNRAKDASAEASKAKTQLASAENAAARATWALHDAQEEASRLQRLIRDELRDVEAALRVQGFTGELLAPPPPPPPPRRWRFVQGCDASTYAGRPLKDGSEVDMAHDFCGMGEDSFGRPRAVCLGPVTPEMGPPVQFPVPMLQPAEIRGERAEDTVRGEPVQAEAV